jgi:dihydroorotate dehydrogenase
MDRLLSALDTVQTAKPRLIKLSADFSLDEVDKIVTVAERHHVQGFLISNLTKQYGRSGIAQELEKQGIVTGGISGKPVQELSDSLIAAFYTRCGKKFVIIGCGGVFSAEDAYAKIRKGASLVQLVTGMIYEGPQLIGEINKGLVALLKRDGYESVSEAIGADYRS